MAKIYDELMITSKYSVIFHTCFWSRETN